MPSIHAVTKRFGQPRPVRAVIAVAALARRAPSAGAGARVRSAAEC